jgi:hypothetical protein
MLFFIRESLALLSLSVFLLFIMVGSDAMAMLIQG